MSPMPRTDRSAATPAILERIRSHFDKQLATGLATGYGPRDSAMWMSSLDTRTGRYPDPDQRPAHIPKRVYRWIDAPRGCGLYWDQPQLVAAHALSALTGDARYADAADRYTREYLEIATAGNGIILWGNHYYYDAFDDAVLWFKGSRPPEPVDFETQIGDYHEMRPLTPAWEIMHRLDAQRTHRAITAAADAHLVEPETGMFNRHADRTKGCCFLEAGGILIETLAWLYTKTGDAGLLAPARKMAQYSFSFREPSTGLISNNPTVTRWDRDTATTEIGLWAGCLLRAAEMTGEDEWANMADDALAAYLHHAWDESARHYFGRLNITDGSPVLGAAETPYEPGDHTALWRPQFPAHDYPMPMAEAALTLYRRTGKPVYETACQRMADIIARSLPAQPTDQLSGGYAEHYGRCLHFALGCAASFDRPRYTQLAQQLAEEAMDVLWAQEMFRTHGGEDRYDAVDAPGFLFLALMWLETGREPANLGLAW